MHSITYSIGHKKTTDLDRKTAGGMPRKVHLGILKTADPVAKIMGGLVLDDETKIMSSVGPRV